jgi:hypothetical protein
MLAAALAGGGAVAFSPTTVRAGNVWDGGGANNDWGTSNNWNPNGAPANNGTAPITFAGTTRLTPNLNTSWSVLSLTFDNTGGAFTLGSGNGSNLTIGTGGITQNDGNTQTIAHAVTLGRRRPGRASAAR